MPANQSPLPELVYSTGGAWAIFCPWGVLFHEDFSEDVRGSDGTMVSEDFSGGLSFDSLNPTSPFGQLFRVPRVFRVPILGLDSCGFRAGPSPSF